MTTAQPQLAAPGRAPAGTGSEVLQKPSPSMQLRSRRRRWGRRCGLWARWSWRCGARLLWRVAQRPAVMGSAHRGIVVEVVPLLLRCLAAVVSLALLGARLHALRAPPSSAGTAAGPCPPARRRRREQQQQQRRSMQAQASTPGFSTWQARQQAEPRWQRGSSKECDLTVMLILSPQSRRALRLCTRLCQQPHSATVSLDQRWHVTQADLSSCVPAPRHAGFPTLTDLERSFPCRPCDLCSVEGAAGGACGWPAGQGRTVVHQQRGVKDSAYCHLPRGHGGTRCDSCRH